MSPRCARALIRGNRCRSRSSVAAQPDPPKPPIVRLPTWVNVVLVLILLASCGANNNDYGNDPDASQIANQVVNQLQTAERLGYPQRAGQLGRGRGPVPTAGGGGRQAEVCR